MSRFDQLLAKVESARRSRTNNLAGFLKRLKRANVRDAHDLVRLHEQMLLICAYPQDKAVQKEAEAVLKSWPSRVSAFEAEDMDLSPLDDPEVSGIAGTSVTSNFSYPIARWLARKYPRQISIDWEWLENEEQWATILPRFLPLLSDDAMVEAHVPFREWLRAAAGQQNEIVWLIDRFESLSIPDKERSELYDALKLHITWKFPWRASRTGMKLKSRKTFFHNQPLIQRRDVSLAAELASPPISVKRLSSSEGAKILDLTRETSAVRYRELHGFTFGDAANVLKADLGRGTEAFLIGVPPEHRLPLRAYHAAVMFKNGVPVGYFEGLSVFERMESGFNLYYTFREGETAWLYARMLRLMRQLLGVTVFSIEPYQIGHENKEGTESGAFWFYRKLGFRPVVPAILKLTEAEERTMAKNRGYRTSERTLRKLAAGYLVYEVPNPGTSPGDWDNFAARSIGLAVQRRMAREFGGDAKKFRAHTVEFVSQALNLRVRDVEKSGDLALVLAMMPNLHDWHPAHKKIAIEILYAKTSRLEATYLKQMQRHALLRAFFIRLGSTQPR